MPNLVGTDPTWHLLRRTTFGPTPDLIAEVRAKGSAAWLTEQMSPELIDDSACDQYLTRWPSLAMNAVQIRAAYPVFSWTPMLELGQATLARALFSRRQLFEVMVEFWTNHFHVMIPGNVKSWDVKTTEDREVIRSLALGRFADLLTADAKSPAMMLYLDSVNSTATALNENYGRELLELHTVGIDAGYTQTDVVNSARILTGFSIAADGTFFFDPSRHYVGRVSVLGFSDPNATAAGGLQVAEAYLAYLASHPATARHLAQKLATRFVSDAPSDDLVGRLAEIYLASGTSIKPVLQELFASAEFLGSFGQKTRRPIEDIMAAMRTRGVSPAAGGTGSIGGIFWSMTSLGQAPMNWGAPNGFPDVTAAWLTTAGTVGRWNTHVAVAQGWFNDGYTTAPIVSLLGGARPTTLEDLVDLVSLRLLGVRLTDDQRSAVVGFLRDTGTTTAYDAINWRLDGLATLVFDSPQWIQR